MVALDTSWLVNCWRMVFLRLFLEILVVESVELAMVDEKTGR